MRRILILTAFLCSLNTLSYNPEHVAKLNETKVCRNCDLEGLHAVNWDYKEIDVQGSNLTNAHLVDCNLEKANLSHVKADRINLSGSNLGESKIK